MPRKYPFYPAWNGKKASPVTEWFVKAMRDGHGYNLYVADLLSQFGVPKVDVPASTSCRIRLVPDLAKAPTRWIRPKQ